ncbi:glutaredoxin [Herpetosiphon giganteus]|nr:glutaredoxin [Herpetosiphon giganteus]
MNPVNVHDPNACPYCLALPDTARAIIAHTCA